MTQVSEGQITSNDQGCHLTLPSQADKEVVLPRFNPPALTCLQQLVATHVRRILQKGGNPGTHLGDRWSQLMQGGGRPVTQVEV